jgi:carbon monoxide dehydrogenase subunit G
MAIELNNSFTVPVSPERAWDVLLDVERIAPCMPGASVTSVEGDEIAGQVKVKLGPLSLSYKGTAKFTGKDAENQTIAIEASGKETRGAGTASATVQAALKPGDADGSTLVSIHTSLNVTGRPAQFGRSLLPEVSGKLIDQFATNLEALIQQDGGAGSGTGADSGSAAPGDVAAPEGAASENVASESTASESTASEKVTSESTTSGEGSGASDTAPAGTNSAATPSAATPSGGTSSAGGSGSAGTPAASVSAPPAKFPQQEESLNLVKLLGGPILKRVIPVAAAAALLAIFGKRLGRAFGKGKSKSKS